MIKFKEIIYYETVQIEKSISGSRQYNCPKCSGAISWNRVPCPDLGMKCLVIHNGYICNLCKTEFQKLEDGE